MIGIAKELEREGGKILKILHKFVFSTGELNIFSRISGWLKPLFGIFSKISTANFCKVSKSKFACKTKVIQLAE